MFIHNNFHSVKEIVLAHTGLTEEEYLNPNPHPYIHNLAEASDLIKKYIADHPEDVITIVGDYDADGICATATLYHALNTYIRTRSKNKVVTRLPKRMTEGYGLSTKIIDEIDSGLIITVDNGIASIDAIKKAKDKGLTVVVTDHHLPVKDAAGQLTLPEADIIVDPHVNDLSEFKYYCGAGLAFRLAQELLPNTNMTSLRPFASIATVADVMPILGTNWHMVREGLAAINANQCPPTLNLLADILGIRDHVTEEDFGFKYSPILNAPGRLYDDGANRSLTYLKLTSPRSPYWKNAYAWAQKLVDINNVRKGKVTDIMEAYEYNGIRPVVEFMPNVGEGMIGLIAGRLCEDYHSPTVIFTRALEPGMLKGSARSIPEIHLKNTLDSLKDSRFKYGGHAGAAGISIREEDFMDFKNAFSAACGDIPEADMDTHYDMEITLQDIPQIMQDLKKYAPFGENNEAPVFLIKNVRGSYYPTKDGQSFSFQCYGLKVFGYKLNGKYRAYGNPEAIHCVGTLSKNWFNGRCTPQMMILDFEPA